MSAENMILLNNKLPGPGNPNWVKGTSGNPRGRAPGARQKLSDHLILAMAASFEQHGAAVLNRLVTDDPATWAKLAYTLLPRETSLKVERASPAGVDNETLEMVMHLVDVIRRNVPEGIDETQVLEFIEHALRAEFAKPIEPVATVAALPQCPIARRE